MTGDSTDNLTTWLELEAVKLGSQNQRERWTNHLLPEDELAALARTELFGEFENLKRWRNISEAEADEHILHDQVCVQSDDAPDIAFETTTHVKALTHGQWESYKLVQEAIDRTLATHPWCHQGGCKLVLATKAHTATCRRCKRCITHFTALVNATWAGRILSREYLL